MNLFLFIFVNKQIFIYLCDEIKTCYMNDYLKEQILSRMRFDNPWWVNGRIQNDYEDMQPRLYLESFYLR